MTAEDYERMMRRLHEVNDRSEHPTRYPPDRPRAASIHPPPVARGLLPPFHAPPDH